MISRICYANAARYLDLPGVQRSGKATAAAVSSNAGRSGDGIGIRAGGASAD